jgi:serine/threonine protein kinase
MDVEPLPEAPLVLGSNPQHSDFSVIEELHRSSGGTVYLARHRPSGRKVVLKERRVSELGRDHELDNEVELYERVPRHPNLIAYLGSYRRGSAAVEFALVGPILIAILLFRPAGLLGKLKVEKV